MRYGVWADMTTGTTTRCQPRRGLVATVVAAAVLTAAGCGSSPSPGGAGSTGTSAATATAIPPATSAPPSAGTGTAPTGTASPGTTAPDDITSPGAPGGPKPGPSATTYPPPVDPGMTGTPALETVSGVVERGVEPGCIILKRPGASTLNLVGGKGRLAPGDRVMVVGRFRTDVASTCMQGSVFEVVRVATEAPSAS